MTFLLASLASLLAMLSGLFGLQHDYGRNFLPIAPMATTTLAIDEINIVVEIADTDAARARGLSGRPALAKNTGMLFVFATADDQSFWMKDMNFPLDIIWLDDHWRVIDVTQNISPKDFPKTYGPRAPARYVLEVNAGFISAHHITIGAQVLCNTECRTSVNH